MEEIKSSKVLKAIARERLLGNYGLLILAYFIMEVIITAILDLVELQSGAYSLIYWAIYILLCLLTAVFLVGQYWMYRKLLRGDKPVLKDMWNGFSHHPDKAILINAMLFGMVFACCIPLILSVVLWAMMKSYYMLPFVAVTFIFAMIACVYISLTFGQALYLLMDYPEESATELLKHSARMMKGHKFQLFYLNISFIGIMLAVVCSFGIGILWAYPYMTCTRTLFYEELYAREPAKHIDIVAENEI